METKNKIDFFLVGSARCGTTSLYNYLNNNNEIYLPKVKEPNFFSDVNSPKLEDHDLPIPNVSYHSKIINSREIYDALYSEAKKNQLKGDTSPSYLWDKNTAKKIFNHNPKAKIIISLRQPVDRAYSHYIMNYYTGVDTSKSFVEALNSNKNEIWGSCNQYLEMGAYYGQVNEYYIVFPKEQIKILIYEDWTKNPQKEIDSLFNFLKVKTDDSIYNNQEDRNRIKPLKKIFILNFLRRNKIKRVIKKSISQERLDYLKSYLFDDNKEIEKLDPNLREDLSLKFKHDIKMLSELTQIDFNKKWY